MEPGYHAESIHVPHTGVRLVLYGYRFNKNLSAQVTYMRPVLWVRYKNVNGDLSGHSVPMNLAGLTIKSQLPINEKLSVFGEAGLGIVTRSGFSINNNVVVNNANYSTFLFSGGFQYNWNDKLSLMAGSGWSPFNVKSNQPATIFFSGGLTYNIHRLSSKRVEENKNSGFIFPANLVQVGYTSNILGYGINKFFSNTVLPIFWGGDVKVKNGISIHYQHNVFHGGKLFSLDWGASFSYYKSNKEKEGFYTLSLYPLFRFTAFHFKGANMYFNYSVAGPTYISKVKIDNTETGKNFTFQDFMGMGIYTGKKRQINAEIRILHYSNGDLFPDNNGVMVPLTLNIGYAF